MVNGAEVLKNHPHELKYNDNKKSSSITYHYYEFIFDLIYDNTMIL